MYARMPYPTTMDGGSNKGLLAYHDVELEETSHVFLEKNSSFLSLLIAPKNINNADIQYYQNSIYISQNHDGRNCRIALNKNPMCIKSLDVEDEDAGKITLKFIDVVYNKPIAKKLFTEF